MIVVPVLKEYTAFENRQLESYLSVKNADCRQQTAGKNAKKQIVDCRPGQARDKYGLQTNIDFINNIVLFSLSSVNHKRCYLG